MGWGGEPVSTLRAQEEQQDLEGGVVVQAQYFELAAMETWRWDEAEELAKGGRHAEVEHGVPVPMQVGIVDKPDFREAKRQLAILRRHQRPGTEASAVETNEKHYNKALVVEGTMQEAAGAKVADREHPNLIGEGAG